MKTIAGLKESCDGDVFNLTTNKHIELNHDAVSAGQNI